MDHVRSQLTVSERRACAVVGQSRSTQRRQPKVRADEAALTEAIVRLATRYGRYGYRRIRRLLLDEGWQVSVKRVYRIWRREGLKVPKKQPKRGRLWLNASNLLAYARDTFRGYCCREAKEGRDQHPGHARGGQILPDTLETPPPRRRWPTGTSTMRKPAAAARICISRFQPNVSSRMPRRSSASRRIARNGDMSVKRTP